MIKASLEKIQAAWQEPAISLEVGDTRLKLGRGPIQATLKLPQKRTLLQLIKSPSMTFGEGFMNGDIKIEGDILTILEGYYKATARLRAEASPASWRTRAPRIRPQTAIKNARHHYDVGNEFYTLWLDPTMAYTCAYFLHENDTLEQAQRQKFELVCRKVRLEPNQSVIDIGCGWGGLMFHIAEHYNGTVTGVVAAKEQGRYIIEEAKRRGLADKVKVMVGDWRDARGQYDRVVSVGVMEHVGERQYPEFFKKYRELLKPDGVAFLHTIGRMAPEIDDPWITKYIFPGGHLPTIASLVEQAGQTDFIVTDVENLWQHYIRTLQHWFKNFAGEQKAIEKMFDPDFFRMWQLYLQGSEAGFRWGGLQLWQLVIAQSKQSPWPLNREVKLNGD